MKATRTMAMAVGAALLATGLFAAPSVEITSVQQQYPWTNTVDIVYTVAGVDSETNGYFVVFTPTTSDGKEILDVNGQKSVQVALKGSGPFTTQWYPQTNQQYTACKMTPSVFRGAAKDYMIVDLETGAVTYEPMATQAASNERYQADAYKTKYLVLRRIEGGKDYWIGGPEMTRIDNIGPNSYHKVSIGQDYYFAIYELTEAQYSRIVGSAVSNSRFPQGGKSWNDVRGSALSSAIPSKGLFATLNAKTALRGFDLPTLSMHEIASRAGCTTKYYDGNDVAAMDNYGWFSENSGGKKHEVGTRKANAWGIYDTVGNMWEYCRDTLNASDLATLQPDGLAPVNTGTSSQTCYKGSQYGQSRGYSHHSTRWANTKTSTEAAWGIRVSYFPQ